MTADIENRLRRFRDRLVELDWGERFDAVQNEVIENGGTLQDAYEIDQSPYMHLPTAEFLAKRNAGQVFQSMEFEF